MKYVSEEYANIRWGKQNLRDVSKKIQDACERIVFWNKNLFMLPTGAAVKRCIAETTILMNGWTNRARNNAWSSDMTKCICHMMGHKFSQFQALSGLF